VCVCVCGLSFSACNAHAPYYIVICGLPRSTILFRIVINGTIFGTKVLNTKCVFWSSLQLLAETFHTLRKLKRDLTINIRRSSCKVTVILVRLWWDLNLLDGFSESSQISNFMKILPLGAESFSCRQTDRQIVIMQSSIVCRTRVCSSIVSVTLGGAVP
jgi:hypothetical protein